MRKIEIGLHDMLDLVASASCYGFADDVFMSSAYEFCRPVTDGEIKKFSDAIASEDGYSVEDGEDARQILTEWRDKHQ